MQSQFGAQHCEDKVRLTQAVAVANSVYGGALRKVYAAMATAPNDEYDWLSRQTDKLRDIVEQAQSALRPHCAEHGCDGNTRS